MKKGSDFHIRLPAEVSSRVSLLAQERRVSRSVIIISALEEFLNLGATAEEHSSTIEEVRKELFEVKRRVSALRGDVEIVAELVSFFIYHWIGYTPRLEKDERLSLAAEAKERHDRFLTLFAKKLALGELSLATVLSRAKEFEQSRGAGANSDSVSDRAGEAPSRGQVVAE